MTAASKSGSLITAPATSATVTAAVSTATLCTPKICAAAAIATTAETRPTMHIPAAASAGVLIFHLASRKAAVWRVMKTIRNPQPVVDSKKERQMRGLAGVNPFSAATPVPNTAQAIIALSAFAQGFSRCVMQKIA